MYVENWMSDTAPMLFYKLHTLTKCEIVCLYMDKIELNIYFANFHSRASCSTFR